MDDKTALERPALTSRAGNERFAQWVAGGCRDLAIPQVLISFHGGEPMLMRAAAFADICEALVRHIAPVAELRFSIQTNGTLLTDGWLAALKCFNVSVGVSIDGTREDHDRYRLDHNNRSTFCKTEAAIIRLVSESRDHSNLRPGTISVLDPAVDYRRAYRYLRKLGIRSMHFLLPDRSLDTLPLTHEKDARAIGNGLLDIVESWLEEDDPTIEVRFIVESIGHFELGGNDKPVRRRRKNNQILVARSDETISIDDSLIPAFSWYKGAPTFPIKTHSLQQIMEHEIFSILEREQNKIPTDCIECRWSKICRGGDLENRFSTQNGFNNRSIYCSTYTTLYRGMFDLLKRNGYPVNLIESRFEGMEYA